jgi:F-type H+-transporting ATPase subunit b
MRLTALLFLLVTGMLFVAAPAMATAEPAEGTEYATPEGGFEDEGGARFHGLKTLELESEAGVEVAHGDNHGTAHAEGGHGESKGLPQFDPSSFPSQLFWLLVAFSVLYFFFSKRSLPEIGRVLQKRQAHIEHDIATAQKLRGNAEEAKARYERAVAEAQSQSTKLYLRAEEEVKAKMAAGLEEFKSRAVLQIKDTEESIEKAKKEAMESIQSIAAEIASVAAEKIVGISTDIDQAKSVVRNINKKAA